MNLNNRKITAEFYLKGTVGGHRDGQEGKAGRCPLWGTKEEQEKNKNSRHPTLYTPSKQATSGPSATAHCASSFHLQISEVN
ncbi:hypothetical protein JTE90_010150 [Oedothorax gibbosus]|uniref:Uncharacterized protein n=1 Tax=Oedothorax gibbosus TaxID=931172 RepID=A0AAV6UHH1_9ARAC|nr:hypothetical protein JTE90_010150 [Oedothorax gibbosus]